MKVELESNCGLYQGGQLSHVLINILNELKRKEARQIKVEQESNC